MPSRQASYKMHFDINNRENVFFSPGVNQWKTNVSKWLSAQYDYLDGVILFVDISEYDLYTIKEYRSRITKPLGPAPIAQRELHIDLWKKIRKFISLTDWVNLSQVCISWNDVFHDTFPRKIRPLLNWSLAIFEQVKL
jgi:hypothetical protein